MTRTAGEFGTWHLREVDVLTSADPAALKRLTQLLRLREYKRGEIVHIATGRIEDVKRVYFLLKGCVKVSSVDDATGRELLLMLVRPGEPFGLLDRPHDPDIDWRARAVQPSLVGYVPSHEFDRFAREAGAFARLGQLADRRTAEMIARFEDLAFRSVRARVARTLLRLARAFPKQRPCGLGIDVPLTQQDLADLVAARREVVSTWMTRLRRDGIVEVHNGRLCIHDRRSLAAMSR